MTQPLSAAERERVVGVMADALLSTRTDVEVEHARGFADTMLTAALETLGVDRDVMLTLIELRAIRLRFPASNLLYAALVEEIGELAEAIEQSQGAARIATEAKQVAAVAIRLMSETDSSATRGEVPSLLAHGRVFGEYARGILNRAPVSRNGYGSPRKGGAP